jgi:hypothetical protein
MVQRLHAAHAALGARAEELDSRAHRAEAEAQRARFLRSADAHALAHAGVARIGSQADGRGDDDGRAKRERARLRLLGQQAGAARAASSEQHDLRAYVRSLDAAIALRPSAELGASAAAARGASIGWAGWDEGERASLSDDGADSDAGGMPMPAF